MTKGERMTRLGDNLADFGRQPGGTLGGGWVQTWWVLSADGQDHLAEVIAEAAW